MKAGFKVIEGNNFAEIAAHILEEAAVDLMIKKELALRTADSIGVSREQANKDIDDVLRIAAQVFEEQNCKDRIQSSIIVQKM